PPTACWMKFTVLAGDWLHGFRRILISMANCITGRRHSTSNPGHFEMTLDSWGPSRGTSAISRRWRNWPEREQLALKRGRRPGQPLQQDHVIRTRWSG